MLLALFTLLNERLSSQNASLPINVYSSQLCITISTKLDAQTKGQQLQELDTQRKLETLSMHKSSIQRIKKILKSNRMQNNKRNGERAV
jgi:hypothetical protein